MGAQDSFNDIFRIVDKVTPMAQKSMEDVSEFIGKTAQTSADLVKKAVDAAQAPGIEESQGRWVDFFKSSLHATRSHADTIMRLNTQVIDLWMDFLLENMPPLPRTETKTGKTKT